jgi:hypothetical protein
MFKRAITHRDEFIVAQALIYALDGLQRLPEDQRPEKAIATKVLKFNSAS